MSLLAVSVRQIISFGIVARLLCQAMGCVCSHNQANGTTPLASVLLTSDYITAATGACTRTANEQVVTSADDRQFNKSLRRIVVEREVTLFGALKQNIEFVAAAIVEQEQVARKSDPSQARLSINLVKFRILFACLLVRPPIKFVFRLRYSASRRLTLKP